MNKYITVRSGKGTVELHTGQFTDIVEMIDRVPRQHRNWQSIKYRGKRYQLFGGIHTAHFICLDSPIGKRLKLNILD